jgi:4-hydroxybenzoate polyprenyltransferase
LAVLIGLARGCHPGPTSVVTLIAGMLAVAGGASWVTSVVTVITVFAGQLSIGWSNDWLDATRDAMRKDKPTAAGAVSETTLRTAAFVALAVTVLLSVRVSWPYGLWQLVLVAAGWLYNIRLKATAFSLLPYAVGFGALPVYALAMAASEVEWWIPICGSLLGVAAHFANVAPDIDLDRAQGVYGVPQRLGARASLGIALALLAASGCLTVVHLDLSPPAIATAAVVVVLPLSAGVWILVFRRDMRRAFGLVMVAAVLDVALLVAVAREPTSGAGRSELTPH